MSSSSNGHRIRLKGSFWRSQTWVALQIGGLLVGAGIALTLVLLALRR
ncbi:hypothetical protein [Subtercola sp. Z020]|nr:hypothetical protein [Subtercola sp. Z020]